MKNLILLSAAIVLLFTGCATSNTTYKTLAGVGFAVDESMKVAATAVADGRLSEATWSTIAATHEQFRTAYRAAVLAASFNPQAPVPADIDALGQAVAKMITAALGP